MSTDQQLVDQAWDEFRDNPQWPGIQGTGSEKPHGEFHLVIYVSDLSVPVPQYWRTHPTIKRLSGFPEAQRR
jgi:hypothetical protein